MQGAGPRRVLSVERVHKGDGNAADGPKMVLAVGICDPVGIDSLALYAGQDAVVSRGDGPPNCPVSQPDRPPTHSIQIADIADHLQALSANCTPVYLVSTGGQRLADSRSGAVVSGQR